MAKKLINTVVKLGENTLLIEALESLGIDFPIEQTDDYVKWHSGKLVQYLTTSVNDTVHTWNFPIPFIGSPRVFALTAGTGSNPSSAWQQSKSNTQVTIACTRTAYIQACAVGRWK